MSKKIPMSVLESYLWDSAVILRTHIDAGAYKQYIFPLLFLKRMSDVYDEECEKIRKDYPDEPDAVNWDENHMFKIPDGAHWNDVRNVGADIGEALVKAFQAIEKENPAKLQGIFGNAPWTNKQRLSDRLLKDLIEHFSSQTLSLANCPEDELGQGYEYLIKKFADDSGHTAQEFYTNRTVVHLMTEMLQPKSGESVYDPTCGSAGMLISCIQYVKGKKQEWRNIALYGQEVNSLSSAIGRMNCYLHGVDDFKIINDDTLAHPAFIENGKLKEFDIVLANPPYSISEWDRTAFEHDKYGRNFLGTPPQGRADYAFIQHILKSLHDETGRCAILLPHGVLFRDEEDELRKNLINKDWIECIIGLGKGLFYNSPMPSCIIICRRNKINEHKDKVLVINAEDEITKIGANSYLDEKQIKRISDAYFLFKNEEGFCKVIEKSEIVSNNYKLNIPAYVPKDIRWNQENMIGVDDAILQWKACAFDMHDNYDKLHNLLMEEK